MQLSARAYPRPHVSGSCEIDTLRNGPPAPVHRRLSVGDSV